MLAEWLGGQSAKGIAALGLSLVTLLAVIDYVTGYEATFAQFYFLPVGLVTYYAAARVGLPVALAATCAWAWVDYFSGHAYSHPLIFAWNVAARFAMFAIVVWLTDSVRSGLERERRDARADFLTGLPNGRAFDERVRAEIAGAARYGYVFSVAHIDIDGFKQVNDSYGHAAGDEVLRIVGHILATNLRANDIAARLGGDEFALFLTRVDAAQAYAVAQKIQTALRAAVADHAYPVDFSIGLLTCSEPPQSLNEVLRQVDRLTYAAKASGKGRIVQGDAAGTAGAAS
ncbi:MAG: GGDEF domain-containing protein [Gammaproteobacteria bacterium]|nr:GGDEF domain-containing protein [Gammaproteobacteria bacterium]